jgi:FkbM family methyltransferase
LKAAFFVVRVWLGVLSRSGVWTEINQRLRKRLPSTHAFLKRQLAHWQLGADPLIPVPRRIDGQFFWMHPRLLTMETRDYEPHIFRWIVDHLPSGGVLFDVGAHYGGLSLRVCRHVGTAGRVIAFEPSPVLLEMLRYHQRRNRLRQMTVVGSAVSETDEALANLHLLNGGLSMRNSLTIGRPGLPFLESVEKTITRVPTVQLDTFCESQGVAPDVIKIDVEGAEGMVLRGATAILSRFRPVLVVSTHPYWLPDSESTEKILDFTFRHGYRVKNSRRVQLGPYEIADYVLVS